MRRWCFFWCVKKGEEKRIKKLEKITEVVWEQKGGKRTTRHEKSMVAKTLDGSSPPIE